MTLTLRDTVTGREVVVEDACFDADWWAYGNGSCDCHRAQYFDGLKEELDAQMRKEHPSLEPWQSVCYGARRVWIVAANTEYSLGELNDSYPRAIGYEHNRH